MPLLHGLYPRADEAVKDQPRHRAVRAGTSQTCPINCSTGVKQGCLDPCECLSCPLYVLPLSLSLTCWPLEIPALLPGFSLLFPSLHQEEKGPQIDKEVDS